MSSESQCCELFAVAERHLGSGTMVSSAKLCLRDALEFAAGGYLHRAAHWALKSMAYSVGRMHPDYCRMAAIHDG